MALGVSQGGEENHRTMWRGHGKRPRKFSGDEEDHQESQEPPPRILIYKDSIYYNGEIRQPEATEFCIELKKLVDRYNDADHVTAYLTTDGGDIFAGLSMYECIRHCRVPVHIVCDSCVSSAGTLVILGAAKRYMYETSVMLVHSLSSWVDGMHKPKQLKEELQNCETLLGIMTDVYKKHTNLTKTNLKSLYDTDLYMRATDCLRHGFIDEIL